MRVLYPELVFGSIASSGVTYATIKDWQYFDIIRQFAPPDCIHQIELTIQTVDRYLTHDNSTRDTIKSAFGLKNLTNDHDFASLLSVSSVFRYSLSLSSRSRSSCCAACFPAAGKCKILATVASRAWNRHLVIPLFLLVSPLTRVPVLLLFLSLPPVGSRLWGIGRITIGILPWAVRVLRTFVPPLGNLPIRK